MMVINKITTNVGATTHLHELSTRTRVVILRHKPRLDCNTYNFPCFVDNRIGDVSDFSRAPRKTLHSDGCFTTIGNVSTHYNYGIRGVSERRGYILCLRGNRLGRLSCSILILTANDAPIGLPLPGTSTTNVRDF